jgi:RNA polymerase sigma-70 factor (ECF subfamily)
MLIDETILQGCIEGKRNAQYQLYRKFSSIMLGVCLRYSQNREEAEDILQESFLKVFQNIASFRKEGSLEGWIKRIMINHALNRFRKNRKQPFYEDIGEINETEIIDTNEEPAINESFPTEILLSMIQSLPQGYRVVFNMYVFEDFSHKEIAETLNISENTSKTQLMKARRLLRKKLEEFKQKQHFAFVNGKK